MWSLEMLRSTDPDLDTETSRSLCGRFVGIIGEDEQTSKMCLDDRVNQRRRAIRAALLAIKPEDILGKASLQGCLLNWADFHLRKWIRENPSTGAVILEDRLGKEGSSVAIVGSGVYLNRPGLFDAIKEQKPTVLIAINRTSQRLPSQEWQELRQAIPGVLFVAAQMDPGVALPGGEALVVPVDGSGIDVWITSTMSDYLFPSFLPRAVVPQPLPAGPSGSQGVLVWLSRILGAKSVTCYCCDGVNGDKRHAYGEQQNSMSYTRHAQRAWTLARSMPLRWVHPKGVPSAKARISAQAKGPDGIIWPAFNPKDWERSNG